MKWRVCTLARASVGVSGLGLPISEGLGWSCKLMPRSTFLWSGPLLLSCVAMVDVVRHGHFRRGHWEVLELGGSLGMGTLSQEFLSPNLSLGFQVALPWET